MIPSRKWRNITPRNSRAALSLSSQYYDHDLFHERRFSYQWELTSLRFPVLAKPHCEIVWQLPMESRDVAIIRSRETLCSIGNIIILPGTSDRIIIEIDNRIFLVKLYARRVFFRKATRNAIESFRRSFSAENRVEVATSSLRSLNNSRSLRAHTAAHKTS